MEPQVFRIHSEYIDLLQFLKATGMAATGGEAKHIVDEGRVQFNGTLEHRRRKKLRAGDHVHVALDPPEFWVIQNESPTAS